MLDCFLFSGAMRRSVFAIAASLLFMIVAQVVGTLGILRRNILTLVGGILMIIAGNCDVSLATDIMVIIASDQSWRRPSW